MIEFVFFGRGGQGAVTAAQMLATAAFREGKYSQAFPSFGPERRGAPVTAYARIDETPIVDRSQVDRADYLLVLDPKVLKTANPLKMLRKNGCGILNVDRNMEHVCKEMRKDVREIYCIDASSISEKLYGKRPIALTNVAMLGAFAAISGVVRLETLLETIDHFFSGEDADKSKKAALMANEEMERVKGS
jgi:2-oxoisovalerate ferredoxin oxidoreductase gamma subunit